MRGRSRADLECDGEPPSRFGRKNTRPRWSMGVKGMNEACLPPWHGGGIGGDRGDDFYVPFAAEIGGSPRGGTGRRPSFSIFITLMQSEPVSDATRPGPRSHRPFNLQLRPEPRPGPCYDDRLSLSFTTVSVSQCESVIETLGLFFWGGRCCWVRGCFEARVRGGQEGGGSKEVDAGVLILGPGPVWRWR